MSSKKRHFSHRLRWLPVWRSIGWLMVVIILALSLMPAPPAAPGGDKLHHFLAYFGLMLFFCQWHVRGLYNYLALYFVLMGIGIEIIQPLTGRYFSWMDMLANTLGVLVAWLLARGPAGRILSGFENWLMRLSVINRQG